MGWGSQAGMRPQSLLQQTSRGGSNLGHSWSQSRFLTPPVLSLPPSWLLIFSLSHSLGAFLPNYPSVSLAAPLPPPASPPAEGRPGCGCIHHHSRAGEGHRLLQTLHDPGNQHSLPSAHGTVPLEVWRLEAGAGSGARYLYPQGRTWEGPVELVRPWVVGSGDVAQ